MESPSNRPKPPPRTKKVTPTVPMRDQEETQNVAGGSAETPTAESRRSPPKKQPTRLSGFLNKLESKAIAGVTRRKCWFVVSTEAPLLLWYRSQGDLSVPLGRCTLSGASFTFDPRNRGLFEIRCSTNEVYSLEASNPQARLRWLQALQLSRWRYFETQEASYISPASRIFDTMDRPDLTTPRPYSPMRSVTIYTPTVLEATAEAEGITEENTIREDTVIVEQHPNEETEVSLLDSSLQTCDRQISFLDDDQKSNFYLNLEGNLNAKSFQLPLKPPLDDVLQSASDVIAAVKERSRALVGGEETTEERRLSKNDEPLERRNRFSIKLPQIVPRAQKPCDGCKELISAMNTLKDYCVDMKDELSATQEVVTVLRNSLAAAKNQIDALQQVTDSELGDRLEFILERETQLTCSQLKCAEQQNEIAQLTDRLRACEERETKAMGDIDAYRDSIRTKEELIMKYVSQFEPPTKIGEAGDLSMALDNCGLAVDVAESVGGGAKSDALRSRASRRNRNNKEQDSFCSQSEETPVEDVAEMSNLRDLVDGYQTQNQFLNHEILELQKMVRYLDEREKSLLRKNFEGEALYYQLKSKYVMLLNHARAAPLSPAAKQPVLEDSLVEELVNEATRGDLGSASSSHLTDSLGFYVGAAKGQPQTQTAADLLNTAAEFKNKADEIMIKQKQEGSAEYVAWLSKWDNFLVNFTDKPLVPSSAFKQLIRTGVPKAYRTRVWKNLVNHWTHDMASDLGNGYYTALVRRSTQSDDNQYDSAIKQIDLDLARTMPGNKYFEDMEAGKIEELRRVLYAYRWHNKDLGYCQGLNRIAAVALLNLSETDAFWFLVAVVAYLQPKDYYTTSLVGVIVDQKVFLDLVNDKLPRIASHLRQLEVDLSQFTLNWFLTCFVDALPHSTYLPLFDDFLYEGNKVLFRFGLAVLRVNEAELLACKSTGSLNICLNKVGERCLDYNRLAQIAFHELNPFSLKLIENRRHHHYMNELKK